ncbi:MAG: hypothetical protein WCS70_09200 [Verrucomicrobiota bacterium]
MKTSLLLWLFPLTILAGPPLVTKPIAFNNPAVDALLRDWQAFPADSPWYQDISKWPVHPNSAAIINSIGAAKPFRYNPDMGFVIVPPNQPRVPVKVVLYPNESDPGPFPVPANIPIEGWPAYYQRDLPQKKYTLDDIQRDAGNLGGDRHGIILDPGNGRLHEFWQLKKTAAGWETSQASTFDLTTNKLRPTGWTSADAAGLPIFPAIVRYDDLVRGIVNHAMRFTVRRTRRAFVAPATHFASRLTDPNLPRMGERLRLKADFDISGFSPAVQAILKGLKKHGMFVADNGIDWAISVAPDERIPVLHEELRRIKGAAFEVVEPPARP